VVGIGHDVDESVLDLVAHTSLKTPTAVADFLVNHNLTFEGNVLEAASDLENIAQNILKIKHLELERAESTARFAAREQTQDAARFLGFWEEKLPTFAFQILRDQQRELDKIEAICQNLHPDNVLRRGFSITTQNGRVVTSSTTLGSGDHLVTRLREGSVTSVVQ
jgi:exodeoxyribonuclease VII large subunit